MGVRHFFICACLFGAAGTNAAADPSPICPDRPGKATSACTVPVGHWQVETGIADWSLQSSASERDTSLTLFETTIKYGLTDASDIEVDFTPFESETSRIAGVRDSASGIGDLNLLYKQRLTSSDLPLQIVAMPFVKIPVARRPLGNGELEAGLLFPIGYAIAKTPLSIGLTPQFDWVADSDRNGHHAAMEQVVTLGWAVTDKWNLSAELWGGWDWDPSGTTRQASVDGSVAYLVDSNLQLDAGADFGLNRATPDLEVYGGISKRF